MNTHVTESIAPFLYFMFDNPAVEHELWIGGVYDGKGSVMSFHTEVGNAISLIRFNEMQ